MSDQSDDPTQAAAAASTSTLPPPVSFPSSSTSAVPAASAAAPTAATAAKPMAKPTSPTLFVSYNDCSVKARVDKEVPLEEIIRQLVGSAQLGITEPAALFALRTESGELVTDTNLSKMFDKGIGRFILTSSPTLEAAEIVEKLMSSEAAVVKLATFSLRTLIQEKGFLIEFEQRGGLGALQEVIRRSSGNTLAYALLSLQNLISDERGWQGLDHDFVKRLVEVIAKEQLINISRPATAILRRLTQSPLPPSYLVSTSLPRNSTGFSVIYNEIAQQPDFMKLVVGRMSSGDVPVATLSLALINSLFKGATEMGDIRFGEELETLDASRVIGNLLESQRSGSGDLSPLLAFQGNLIAFLHLSLTTPVEESSYGLFDDVWQGSGLEDGDPTYRWRRLGFKSESPQYEFDQSGVLGLKALAYFSLRSGEFAALLKEQSLRPIEKRCPVATVSTTVLLLITEHFDILSGINQSPTIPQPNLLRFYECHALAVTFFVRIWNEGGAKAKSDLERITALTRSQIGAVLNGGLGEKPWFQVKQEFADADYKTVRDRQMRELEIEDDILSKAPVRNLRGRLYRESYEFVQNQRILCLHEGAWFRTGPGKKGTPKSYRFYRLAANRKVLHYLESTERVAVKAGLDDLPERIDLSLVTEILGGNTGTKVNGHSRSLSAASNSGASFTHRRGNSNATASANPLSFSLLSADGTVIAELLAPDEQTHSEWVDGLSLLHPEGNISTKETANFVQILTEIGVKVKLLDLSGEKVEIPSSLAVGPVPTSTEFYYADYST